MTLENAIQTMTNEIATLVGHNPTIYLYGSVVHNDFKLGWSDIDFIAITESEISESQANALVHLRQAMENRYPSTPYFRLFEGNILSIDALVNPIPERIVYWGTSGQRITNSYHHDAFTMLDIQLNGILLHGNDIRTKLTSPSFNQLRKGIANHAKAARKHGTTVGWLLDIARGIYTLRTGQLIPKTAAAEWAIENNLCPDPKAMSHALKIRKAPHMYTIDERKIDNAIIQQFCDVLDKEIAKE